MELFSVQDLTFSYPGQTVPALERLSFDISAGEFLVIAGPSGCGKSTLLRQFKTALTPHGSIQGQLLFQGSPLKQVDPRTQASKIGFVQQNPDNQIVTDKVWHELAFGLESLGYDRATIRGRVAEMASFFGIQAWFLPGRRLPLRWTEAAAEPGLRHGHAAGGPHSGRANQPAGSHCCLRLSGHSGPHPPGSGRHHCHHRAPAGRGAAHGRPAP